MPRRSDPAELARRLLPLAAGGAGPPAPDEELLARYVRATDPAAFQALYDRYAGLVYRVCRRGLGADEADPAFQAVWLVFARKAHTVRDGRAVAGWLARVAARVVRKARRRAAARPALPLGDYAGAVVDPEPAADPDRRAELRDLAEAVAREVARLPDHLREVFELCHLEGLGRTDTILRLGLSPLQFDRRMRKARDLLQTRLGRLGLSVPASLTVAAACGPASPPAELVRATAAAAFAGRAGPWGRVGLPPAAVALARGTTGGRWAWAAAVGAAVAFAGAALAVRPEPEPAPPLTAPAPEPVPEPPRESLQAKNLRILKAEVLPRVIAELGAVLPDGAPWAATEVLAVGSEVRVEFGGGRAARNRRIRMSYCVHMRRFWAGHYDPWDGSWPTADPEQPATLRVPVPGPVPVTLPAPYVLPNRWGGVERAFARLPPDGRAEGELVGYLFGPADTRGREVVAPEPRSATANSNTLFVCFGNGTYARRLPAGDWRYWGMTLGWGMAADEDRLFCYRDQAVWAYPVDAPAAAPVRVCDSPERLWLRALAVGGGFLVAAPMSDDRREVWVRPLAGPAAWARVAAPGPVRAVVLDRGDILAACDGRLVRCPAARPGAPWVPAGPTPGDTQLLVVVGGRLLHVPPAVGPVHARPLTAGPGAEWEVVGRVRGHDGALSSRPDPPAP